MVSVCNCSPLCLHFTVVPDASVAIFQCFCWHIWHSVNVSIIITIVVAGADAGAGAG